MEAGDFEEPNGFHSKHPLQRIAILFAGPLANFLIAMLLITGFELTQLNDDPGKIQRVVAGNARGGGGSPGRRQRPHCQRQAGHRARLHLQRGERPPGTAAGADGRPP